jgi:hypothetical protein
MSPTQIAFRDVTIYRSFEQSIRDVAVTWTSDKPRRILLISAYLKLKNLGSHVVFTIAVKTDENRH